MTLLSQARGAIFFTTSKLTNKERSVRLLRLLPMALLTFSACVSGESPQQASARMAAEAAAARSAITAANKQWMAAIAGGHADSLALLYVPNARMMGAGSPTSVGREAIGRAFGAML